ASIAYEAAGGSLEDDFLLLYDTDSSDLGLSVVAHKTRSDEPGHFVLMMTPKQLWPDEKKTPQDVVFVVDTSGSMSGEKLADAKLAAATLVGQLEPGDSVSLVGFSTRATTFQAPTTIHHVGSTLDGLTYLDAGGDTNMSDGLWNGISNLNAVTAHGSKRLVLLGDGHATAGSTSTSTLAAVATGAQQQGITVSALGLGLDFDLDTMAAIADAGGG
ncbi:MAG: VWA domain-containing protein, partial [Proteobacteria bacterium]|nr:VWA domain-containing protein [Pseudomonadota bacterium]